MLKNKNSSFIRINSLGNGFTGIAQQEVNIEWKLYPKKHPNRKYKAKVPGNVRISLLKSGEIDDPFIGQNNEKSKWISEIEWIYESTLNVKKDISELYKEIKKDIEENPDFSYYLHLCFDAIDYNADFYLENRKICNQTGMFSPVDIISIKKIDLMDKEKNKGNDSEIEIPIKIDFKVQPFWRTHAVKCQMAFGWDFAPDMRTIGPWKPLRVYYTGPVMINNLYSYVEFKEDFSTSNISPKKTIIAPIVIKGTFTFLEELFLNDDVIIDKKKLDKEQALISNKNINHIDSRREITLKLKFRPFKSSKELVIEKKIFLSSNKFKLKLDETELQLWYPKTLGEPYTIPIEIEVYYMGVLSDIFRGKIINRKIKWLRNPFTIKGNENWTIEVNGQKMFIKGMNWVPIDSLYSRISKEKYEILIEHALNLNIDMFRVWGGGIEEKKEFYELCDEKGIMIFQEFPFACTNYPKDKKYLEIVEKEIFGITERTRLFPSVVVYCGGNEFNPFINSHIISIVNNAISKLAPDRHCFSASPYLGDDHNWRVWGYRRMFDAYEINGIGPFQMLTEFGYQSAPNIETLKMILDEKNRIPPLLINKIKPDLEYHRADINNHLYYAKKFGTEITNAKDLIRISQQLQSEALKYAIEVCRSAWPNVSGVFPWQFSDPWPNDSWSIIDYNLKPKLSYEMMKILYAPVLPMIRHWSYIKNKARKEKRIEKGNQKGKENETKSKNLRRMVSGKVIIHNSTQKTFQGHLIIYLYKNKEKFTSRQMEKSKENHREKRKENNREKRKENNREKSKENNKEKALIWSKKYNISVSSTRPLFVTSLSIEYEKGTLIRLELYDNKGKYIISNFSFPVMEPPVSKLTIFKDWVDARFDGWWRKHMTKLMEQERIREDHVDWAKKKREIENIRKDLIFKRMT